MVPRDDTGWTLKKKKKIALYLNKIKTVFNYTFCEYFKWKISEFLYDQNIQIQIMYDEPK